MEYYMTLNGSEKASFETIVSSGICRSTLAVRRLCTIIPFNQVAVKQTSTGGGKIWWKADRFEVI
ncbi:hypothetical protein BK140_24030 [Paenibacillus macerans]|nr:hypothetical protein BK140_24030 [Paenibacillus macerans]